MRWHYKEDGSPAFNLSTSFPELISFFLFPIQSMSSQSETPPTGSIDHDKVNAQYIEKAEGSQQTIWDVLPKNQPAWWRQKHLLLLNLGMVIPYLSSTTNGYDGSMLNGLQSMVCLVVPGKRLFPVLTVTHRFNGKTPSIIPLALGLAVLPMELSSDRSLPSPSLPIFVTRLADELLSSLVL